MTINLHDITGQISIHALRKESDADSIRSKTLTTHFNPRSP